MNGEAARTCALGAITCNRAVTEGTASSGYGCSHAGLFRTSRVRNGGVESDRFRTGWNRRRREGETDVSESVVDVDAADADVEAWNKRRRGRFTPDVVDADPEISDVRDENVEAEA